MTPSTITLGSSISIPTTITLESSSATPKTITLESTATIPPTISLESSTSQPPDLTPAPPSDSLDFSPFQKAPGERKALKTSTPLSVADKKLARDNETPEDDNESFGTPEDGSLKSGEEDD